MSSGPNSQVTCGDSASCKCSSGARDYSASQAPADPCCSPTHEMFSPALLSPVRFTFMHLTCLPDCILLNSRKKTLSLSPLGFSLSRYPINILLDKNSFNFREMALKSLHILHGWARTSASQASRGVKGSDVKCMGQESRPKSHSGPGKLGCPRHDEASVP